MSASAEKAHSSTGQTFVTALVINAALLGVQVGAFLLLRQKLARIYSPRSYLPPEDKRAEALPEGLWRWLPAILLAPTEDIIQKNGLDAYMFLRFLKMLIWIFLVFTVLTWAVILPIDAAGVKSQFNSLERLSWSNISGPHSQERYSAHIIVVYILTFFIIFMIRREMLHFVHMRHQFLISKSHSRLPQARTVLITSVPEELANEADLRKFASFVPGGVDRVWIYRDTKTLNQLFEHRQTACNKLEAAEAKLLRLATIAWRARLKLHQKSKSKKSKAKARDEENATDKTEDDPELKPPDVPTREFLEELVSKKKAPRHRIGLMGLLGRKVDTIDWYKDEIARLNKEIHNARKTSSRGDFQGSVFIRCNLQLGAHVLAQCVSYHEPLAMYGKWIEVNPRDVVWENLDDGAAETRVRYVISWAATFGLIVLWTVPVGFVGTLSKVDELCGKVNWLRWVCKAPTPIPGIIQGALPPVILAVLFIVLPIILRGLAWYECIPRYSLMSVSVYRRYFFFLLFHGFVTVTLASSVVSTIEAILDQPAKTVQQLASRIPGASIFFLTYLAVQGLAGAGSALMQIAPLLLYFIRKWFLGRTPRQAYAATFVMPSADFGVILPQLSLLVTIGFAYSVISPIINALALLSFFLFFLAWKFLLTQVFDQPDESETGGLYFPMAISNLFAGLYIEQICLACLFFLKVSISRASSLVEGGLMVVLVLITAAAQILIHQSFDPITDFLPMSLAMKKLQKKHEHRKEKEKRKLGGITEEIADDIDLFSRDRLKSVRRRFKLLPNQQKQEKEKDEEVRIEVQDKAKDQDQEKVAVADQPSASTGQQGIATGLVPDLARQRSNESSHSKISSFSKASKASSKATSKKSVLPVFSPPAAALSDDDSSDDDDDDDHHAFDPPSTYVDQPWIWLPKDTLHLSEILIEDLKKAGIDASDLGAVMDEKGVVEVSRNPPDEDWSGGHDE